MAGSLIKALALTVACLAAAENPLERGWGDMGWVSMDEALAGDKPIMTIVWATWCGACKNMRPKFAVSEAIMAIAPKFSMVNLEVGEDAAHAGGERTR